ncbi:MAG: hypothetical protein TR69_WS6001001231 [candidate division WS6 bacterium OLB20]|uniref:Transcobalamin-like C-terminal domain-containing protein n=1 Tax=candidate division WS6 bacterium OLB20 TaxID=1617426 RepID=A0A136LX76_9BACT|nr:MAG: hypothetical protein TR69_WS6001001231 [candidate division WS6 bacterium OLB20]
MRFRVIISVLIAAASVFILSTVAAPPGPDVAGRQSEGQATVQIVLPDTVVTQQLQLTEAPLEAEIADLDEKTDDVSFSYTDYDFGRFITGINGIEADPSSQFWELSVNGTPSGTGISDLQLQTGDTVTFRLVGF